MCLLEHSVQYQKDGMGHPCLVPSGKATSFSPLRMMLGVILCIYSLSNWGSFPLILGYCKLLLWILFFYLSFLACRCDGNMASRKLKITYMIHIQFSSVAQSCPTLCNPVDCSTPASLSITNSQSLLKLIFIELVKPSNYLILCHPLLLLPSIFLSIRVFSLESVLCIRWPKYGVSALESVRPRNIQDWFPLGLTGWMSLQSKGLSRVFSNTTVQNHQFFGTQLSL